MKLANGAELTAENLINLIEEEGILCGPAMRRNIECGKLKMVAKRYNLLATEEDTDKAEYEALRERLHALRTRLDYLTDEDAAGGWDVFSTIGAAMGTTDIERAQHIAKAEAEAAEADKVRKEICNIEKQIEANAWFKFLGPCVSVKDI